MEIISFLLLYSLFTVSIIGYGLFFSLKLTKYNNFTKTNISVGYLGLLGIFSLIFISYFTNLFFAHTNEHNIIIILLGIIFFAYLIFNYKKKIKLKFFFISYIISLFAIFYFKSHDDFQFYHFSFIKNITENKIEFGLGHFNYAFSHVSSLFYFNSLFKTYFTNHYFYQIGQLSIMILANTILLENILNKPKNSKLDLIFFVSLFCIFFINIFFYRLAEHGTDRSAQILFFLCIIIILDVLQLKKILNKSVEILLILFTLIITIKSFYILYTLVLFFIYFRFYKLKDFPKIFRRFSIVYMCLLMFILMLIYSISNSGCLLYPVEITCADNLFWSYGKDKIISYMSWYELWSKAGATPALRVENPEEYLSGLNWVGNWLDSYFFNKVSDYILGIIVTIIITISFFRVKKLSLANFEKFKFLYLGIFILFLEWFLQHPSLRYGGYVLIFLLLTFPISIILSNQNLIFIKEINFIKIILLITLVIFAGRNINRLNNENRVYNYNLFKNPYYRIADNFTSMQDNKKIMLNETNNCTKINSIGEINCKKIYGYNFYFLNKK